ncbi:hypothetical protein [Roseicella aquatilis]|uniref:Uncharacterized protein n=1 Tax=Roseicella aquatilis TaxID=2527868 RepID=A0A4R4D2Q0_9PROT|nr:hypothetical protein [Roseicella aquatilis]TCZ51103.1 hypothetical protein EXY23_27050 [Roseicella aquatilis]
MTAQVGGRTVFAYSRPRLDAEGRPDGGTLWATFRIAEFQRFYASVLGHPGDVVKRGTKAQMTTRPR